MDILKPTIRTKFVLTSRQKALQEILAQKSAYRALADQLDDQSGRTQVQVPKMPGVDEDMRNWSFFMLLEHNVIVNRVFTITVKSLANGKIPPGIGRMDPKKDVMPGTDPGIEQVEAFFNSIDRYLETVSTLPALRGTPETPHPLFGSFDAHKWHCMMGFHLGIHLKQAKLIAESASRRQA